MHFTSHGIRPLALLHALETLSVWPGPGPRHLRVGGSEVKSKLGFSQKGVEGNLGYVLDLRVLVHKDRSQNLVVKLSKIVSASSIVIVAASEVALESSWASLAIGQNLVTVGDRLAHAGHHVWVTVLFILG